MDYLQRLKDAGVGEKNIVWVSHSMGGERLNEIKLEFVSNKKKLS